MNKHDATETAYKNGYKQGKADCAREIIDILKSAGINKWRYPVIHDIENKYTESEKDK